MDKRIDTFHSVVMKIIWIAQRGRPDCDTAISFLYTRMNHPDVEYWMKSKRLLCFMNQKIEYERKMGENDLHEMKTYVDSSHVVHM